MIKSATVVVCLLFIASPLAIANPAGPCANGAGRPVLALFTNATGAAGLSGVTGDQYAWGDYNNDGWDDLLVKGNRLFRNDQDGTFTEATAQTGVAGYGYAVWGDYNNDGHLDFFCAGSNESYEDTLWRNTGPPNYSFVNASAEAGGVDDGYGSSCAAVWVDYDRDGYLDAYVMNYRDAAGILDEDALWHNNGNGTFTRVTRSAGIKDFNPVQAGMGCTAGDYNNDGWPDIYAGNYLLGWNYLWANNHNGTFTDLGKEVNVSGTPKNFIDGSGPYYGHTAGSCWGDYNNDGLLDLWVGNLAHKDTGTTQRALICDNPMLMKNLGFPFRYVDVKEAAGMPNIPNGDIMDSQWHDDDTFGGAWCDYDNDGWLDLYVPQVKGYHSWSYSQLWHNNGDGTFSEVGNESGIRVWANIGTAWADYDNDGQMDHITEGTYPYAGPRGVHLLHNEGTASNYLKVALTGVESNRAAIGARITVTNGTLSQMREVEGGTGGHAYQNSLTLNFGFGSYSGTVSVCVRWPSGIVQNLTGVTLNRRINITEDASGPRILALTASNYAPVEGESVTFQCTVSGSPATLLWDNEGDGKFDQALNSNSPVQVSYDRAGRYYPSVKILNGAGTLGEWESLQLIVRNLPPVSNAGGNRTVNETEPIAMDGSDSTDTANDVPSLLYNWSFSDGKKTGFQSSPETTRVFNQSGTIQATLCVKDNDNATSNDTVSITVLNLPPSCTIQMPNTTFESFPLAFNATGSDTVPDLPSLRYRWDFGDGISTQYLTSPNLTHAYTSSGTYKVSLTVRDDNFDTANATIFIEVADVAPSGSCEFSEFSVEEDTSVTLTGTGYDTPGDSDTLAYRWDFGDGTGNDWGSLRSATHVYSSNGTYRGVFHVRDNDNLTATASCNVTVMNIAPFASVSNGDISVVEDSEVPFDGSGRDTPTDQMTLLYNWSFGDGNSTGYTNASSVVYTYTRAGNYHAVFTVRDNNGLTAIASVDITVENAAPVASARASKYSVDEDTPVEFNASGSKDTPSDQDTLAYAWDFGDGETGAGPIAVHSFARKKNHRVTLTVTDDDNTVSTAQLDISVKNLEPQVSARANRTRILTGQSVGFTSQITDTPGDTRTLKVVWTFGDGRTADGANVSHRFDKTGYVSATVKATDDDGASCEYTIQIEVAEPPKMPVTPPPKGIDGTTIASAGGGAGAACAVAAALLMMRRKKTPPSSGAAKAEPEKKTPPAGDRPGRTGKTQDDSDGEKEMTAGKEVGNQSAIDPETGVEKELR